MMAARCAVNSLSRASSSTVDCCRGRRLLRHRILHFPSPLQLVIFACLLVYSLADDAHELRETPLARAGHVTSVSNNGAFVIDSLEKALVSLLIIEFIYYLFANIGLIVDADCQMSISNLNLYAKIQSQG